MNLKSHTRHKTLAAWLLITLPLLTLLTGLTCNKDKDTPAAAQGKYYVRFKVNGMQHEYLSDIRVFGSASEMPVHPYGYNVNTYDFGIEGYGDEQKAFPTLQVKIESQKVLKQDSVYKTVTVAGAINGYVNIYYAEPTATVGVTTDYRNGKNVQVTFTDVTGTTIKGIFSGSLSTNDNTKQAEITDGEFFALRVS